VIGEILFSDFDCNYINTSVHDISDFQLRVCPNPTSAIVYIEDPAESSVGVLVYDALGRPVVAEETGTLSFDLSSTQAGYYSVLILKKGGQ